MILRAPTEVPNHRNSIVDNETAVERNANQCRHKIIFRSAGWLLAIDQRACPSGRRGDVMDSSPSLVQTRGSEHSRTFGPTSPSNCTIAAEIVSIRSRDRAFLRFSRCTPLGLVRLTRSKGGLGGHCSSRGYLSASCSLPALERQKRRCPRRDASPSEWA
jgi:hypothetical protein